MPSAWPFRPPSTWQQVPVKPVIRSEVEDGYPKTRRRYTKVWYQYQTNFRLHWNDYDAFWTFWRVDCQGGASPLTFSIRSQMRLFWFGSLLSRRFLAA